MLTSSRFNYIILIKSNTEKVWNAITRPEITRQYWRHENISSWKQGSEWLHVADDNKRSIRLIGEVVKAEQNKLLILTWVDPTNLYDKSQVTIKIDSENNAVRLSVKHEGFTLGSKMLNNIRDGWPRVLSSMKSFLETGKPLITWDN